MKAQMVFMLLFALILTQQVAQNDEAVAESLLDKTETKQQEVKNIRSNEPNQSPQNENPKEQETPKQEKTESNQPIPNIKYFIDKQLFDRFFIFGTVGNIIFFVIGLILFTKPVVVIGQIWIFSRVFDYWPALGIIYLAFSFYQYEKDQYRRNY